MLVLYQTESIGGAHDRLRNVHDDMPENRIFRTKENGPEELNSLSRFFAKRRDSARASEFENELGRVFSTHEANASTVSRDS
jgi:hypothetical protein